LVSIHLKSTEADAKVITLRVFTIPMSYSKHCTSAEKEKVFIMWR
jgi:hypothetical protein